FEGVTQTHRPFAPSPHGGGERKSGDSASNQPRPLAPPNSQLLPADLIRGPLSANTEAIGALQPAHGSRPWAASARRGKERNTIPPAPPAPSRRRPRDAPRRAARTGIFPSRCARRSRTAPAEK